jgi:hypothetical protein
MVRPQERVGSNDITHDYEPCGDDMLDIAILEAVEAYYTELLEAGGKKLEEFPEKDIKTKLNEACWDWANSSDPEAITRSADLKSKLWVRKIALVAFSGNPSLVENKHVTPLNPYWREMDDRFHTDLREFIVRNHGTLSRYDMDFSKDSNEFQRMANIGTYAVHGRFQIRDGLYLHGEYLTGHSSLTVDQLHEAYRVQEEKKREAADPNRAEKA